ncbi:MAG: UbiD family decarboxylase, partial [Chloroflexi bacterium]|nr:UbiD family decarboxylase [Chloroflexota bacterium]
MGYKDLRQWLRQVEDFGQIKKIEGADWNLEMGAITEVIYREGKLASPPAVLFERVPGYPEDFRVLFGLTCSVERMALTLGFS